jgi:hypothetical protein
MAHPLRIFAGMKTKLTLSVTKARVRRVKSYSAKRKKSVSQLFEEFIDSLDKEKAAKPKRSPARKKYAIDEFAGMLTDKITQEELDADARLAHIFRKG